MQCFHDRNIHDYLSSLAPQHPIILLKLSPAIILATVLPLLEVRSPKPNLIDDRAITDDCWRTSSSLSWRHIAFGGVVSTSYLHLSPVEASSKTSPPNVLVYFNESTGNRKADQLASVGGDIGSGSICVELPESWGQGSVERYLGGLIGSPVARRHGGLGG